VPTAVVITAIEPVASAATAAREIPSAPAARAATIGRLSAPPPASYPTNAYDLLSIIVVNEFAGAEESSGASSTARLLASSQKPSAADFVGLVPCPANAVSTSRSA
jgi:hypothetical protein